MAELVDAHVSGACAERREGSSPFLGTKIASDCFVEAELSCKREQSQVYLSYAECSLKMPLLKRNCRASESRNQACLSLCRAQPDNAAKLQSNFAEIAQLVEHNLAKVGVASPSLVFRSIPIS